jgi:hypothetical protein
MQHIPKFFPPCPMACLLREHRLSPYEPFLANGLGVVAQSQKVSELNPLGLLVKGLREKCVSGVK